MKVDIYFGHISQRKVSSSAASEGKEHRGEAQARLEENILTQELKELVWCLFDSTFPLGSLKIRIVMMIADL